MIEAAQVRAGRALIGWSQTELANAAGLPLPLVEAFGDRAAGNVFRPGRSEDARDAWLPELRSFPRSAAARAPLLAGRRRSWPRRPACRCRRSTSSRPVRPITSRRKRSTKCAPRSRPPASSSSLRMAAEAWGPAARGPRGRIYRLERPQRVERRVIWNSADRFLLGGPGLADRQSISIDFKGLWRHFRAVPLSLAPNPRPAPQSEVQAGLISFSEKHYNIPAGLARNCRFSFPARPSSNGAFTALGNAERSHQLNPTPITAT